MCDNDNKCTYLTFENIWNYSNGKYKKVYLNDIDYYSSSQSRPQKCGYSEYQLETSGSSTQYFTSGESNSNTLTEQECQSLSLNYRSSINNTSRPKGCYLYSPNGRVYYNKATTSSEIVVLIDNV